jgi:hypothetical protein
MIPVVVTPSEIFIEDENRFFFKEGKKIQISLPLTLTPTTK